MMLNNRKISQAAEKKIDTGKNERARKLKEQEERFTRLSQSARSRPKNTKIAVQALKEYHSSSTKQPDLHEEKLPKMTEQTPSSPKKLAGNQL